MKRTAVKKISDFEFQSDFSAPKEAPEDTSDTVSVTARELAELLASARQEGLNAAQTQLETEQAERLNTVSDALKTALDELVKLAAHLDRSALPPRAQSQIKQLITAACLHIVNGQRDLFADQ